MVSTIGFGEVAWVIVQVLEACNCALHKREYSRDQKEIDCRNRPSTSSDCRNTEHPPGSCEIQHDKANDHPLGLTEFDL